MPTQNNNSNKISHNDDVQENELGESELSDIEIVKLKDTDDVEEESEEALDEELDEELLEALNFKKKKKQAESVVDYIPELDRDFEEDL